MAKTVEKRARVWCPDRDGKILVKTVYRHASGSLFVRHGGDKRIVRLGMTVGCRWNMFGYV